MLGMISHHYENVLQKMFHSASTDLNASKTRYIKQILKCCPNIWVMIKLLAAFAKNEGANRQTPVQHTADSCFSRWKCLTASEMYDKIKCLERP